MDLEKDSKKVAVITGASSGIGKACAFRFADEGYSVALVARRSEELSAVEMCIRDSIWSGQIAVDYMVSVIGKRVSFGNSIDHVS